jgi:4-carboxymuconolactone decarboxylase
MSKHPIGLDRNLSGASEEQNALFEKIAQGPRGSVPSPFLAMLDRPLLADAIQQVGAMIRFSGVLSDADRELAILATAGTVGCRYEWDYHAPIGVKAGLADEAIRATLDGIDPKHAGSRWATIVRFCRAVVRDRKDSDVSVADMIALLGKEQTSEIIAICGYYALLASFIMIGKHEPE